MISSVKEFKEKGLANLGIGLIRLYQQTWSQITPARCRYSPSCSEYTKQAIERFGLLDGLKLGWRRIQRCRPPFKGVDPVPLFNCASQSSDKNKQSEFEIIKERTPRLKIEEFEHQFKLILAYPLNREFYSKSEFTEKIAQFNDWVLEVEQYAILYRVNRIEIGTIFQHYLVRFSGTTSSVYLENKVDEIVGLLISQLEGFLLTVQKDEFRPLYFELDGQILIQPEVDEPALPKQYSTKENFWQFTSNSQIWDDYWGTYEIGDFVNLLSQMAVEPSHLDISDLGCDLNPFDGDGCDFPLFDLECDLNPFDGNGCEFPQSGCGDGCSDGCGNGCDGCGDGCGQGCSF